MSSRRRRCRREARAGGRGGGSAGADRAAHGLQRYRRFGDGVRFRCPITVFAAASLKSTFTELGRLSRPRHRTPGWCSHFAGSSDPVHPHRPGRTGRRVRVRGHREHDEGRPGRVDRVDPVNFATNTLTIVTPPGNPGGVTSFADLARPGLDVVVCAPQVPCGNATQRIEDDGGAVVPGQRGVVGDRRARQGRDRAGRRGIVYVTDAAGAGDKVESVPFRSQRES